MPDYNKNASAVLDYNLDYSTWLGTDIIASAAWQVPAGISATSNTATTAVATVWLSGGTPGNVYRVTNQIWTSGGRTQLKTFEIGVG